MSTFTEWASPVAVVWFGKVSLLGSQTAKQQVHQSLFTDCSRTYILERDNNFHLVKPVLAHEHSLC